MAYEFTNSRGQKYHLHSKDVKLRSGRMQTIYFFAKEAGADAIDQIPPGFIVVENQRTGLPVLKRG